MHLIEFVAEVIGARRRPADRRGRGIFAKRLIETLDAVGEEIEPGDVVLDPVDALQVLVDDSSAASTSFSRSEDAVGRAPRASIR